MKNGLFKKWLAAALCVLALGSTAALAEPDSFGVGTGRDLALSVTTAGNVINSYAPVTGPLAPGDMSIPVGTCVGAASCFSAGDLVMVLQTTGIVPVPGSGGTTAVDISNDPVGRWEFARLASGTTGTTLMLTAPLVYAYAANVTQVIRVPEYTTVTLTGPGRITPFPWNGSVGGVIAFLATGTVSNAGQINASGLGFRGGAYVDDDSGALGCTGLDDSAPSGAQKGEGIANVRYGATHTGRGNVINGAGGGVCYKSGGGGGGNYGAGGVGGRSDGASDGARLVGGLGGTALVYSLLNHLTLGGGGGAGHGSDGTGVAGGRGGGAIFIRANQLTGAGSIQASGGLGGVSNSDGGSGGGAGGSIYLRFVSTAACGSVSVNGGIGGNVNSTQVGPGGGGGGGRVLFQAATGGTCNLNLIGAAPGTQLDTTAPDSNTYGARQGSNGVPVTLSGGFVVPPVPSVVTPANGSITNNPRPPITGTARPSTTVIIYIDGVEIGRTISDAAGNYSYTPITNLSEGSHQVQAATEVDSVLSPKSTANTFTVDITPPPAPVVSTPANGAVINVSKPAITGTAEPNSTVTVIIDGTAVGTVTATAAGNWSYTPATALPDGPHNVKATAKDAAGNTSPDSNTNTFTVDTVAPTAPTVTAPTEGAYLKTNTPVITGKAEANSTVTVILDGTVVGTVVADAAGNWSYTPATALTDGPHNVKATAKDAAGNTSPESAVRNFTVDTVVPVAPVVVSPSTGSVLKNPKPAITGTAEANSTVTVILDGVPVAVVPADGSGNWSYTPASNLLDGPHEVKATATDAAGNTSVESNTNTFIVDTVVPTAPVVTAPAEGAHLNVPRPAITGTAEAGSTVTVIIDGTVVGTVTANGSGNWSYTPTTDLADGAHQVKATATDAAGNTSPESAVRNFIVDTLPPPAPIVTTPANGAHVKTPRPVIRGTAEANSTVTVYIDGTAVGTVTADGSGNWNYTPTTDLSDGSHQAKATAKDAAGNTSVDSNTNTFIVDTAAPVAPVVTAPAEGAHLNVPRPVITGTAEAGSTVTVIIDGVAVGTVAADGSGNWSYTPTTDLADGAHQVKATATDAAGNTSPESAVRNFIVDTLPPPAPIVTAPANGAHVKTPRPVITGTAEANSTVTVYIDGTAVGTVTADGSGNWSYTPTTDLSDGAHQAKAKATDAAGNTSVDSNTNTFTVDTVAPIAPVVTAPAEGAHVKTATPVITGTAEAGSTVTVIIDGVAVGTVAADGSGNWSYTPTTALTDGPHNVKATATDAAGNTSPESAVRNFIVDTAAPIAPVVTAPAEGAHVKTPTPVISGTAEANSTVTVIIDGVAVGTVAADGSGNWSYTPTTALADGAHQVKATATDAAGNTSAESAVRNFIVDTAAPIAPVVTTPANGAHVKTPRPVISGTAEANSTVTVYIDGTAVGTVTADGSGNWSYTPTTDLSDGAHQGKATATDAAGNTSVDSNTNTFTVDTAAPVAPLVTAPAEGAHVKTPTPVISGTAEANSIVTVIIDGTVVGTATADGSGNWSYTPAAALTDGPHQVKAKATDAAGNTSPESAVRNFIVDTAAPIAPVVTAPAEGAHVKTPTPVISGTAEANSTVTVIIDGTAVGTVTADSSGNWSYTPTTALADGAHQVKATATDAAGNTSAESNVRNFIVDTVAPVAPVVSAPTEGTTVKTPTPVISGTAEAGSTVTVIIDGVAVGTVTADGSGNWSYTPTTGLGDGPHTVKATATDAAGNTSPESAARNFSVDTGAPDTSFAATPPSLSNSSSATFDFSSNETGVTYECRLDGATTFTACTDPQTFTGLADGSHTLNVRARDAAGNVDATPASYSWTVDTLAPAAPVVTSPAATVDTLTPVISGTAEPHSTVTVIIDGVPVGTVKADGSGNWSYTPTTPLAAGPHSVTVTATDAAGNTSEASGRSFTILQDTVAPDTTITSGPSDTTSERSATFAFSSNEPGVTYECSLDGAAFTACVSPVTFTDLSEGEHTFQVRARDAAGNVDATPATRTWTVATGNTGGDIAFLGDGFGCSATGGDSSLVLMGLGTFLALARRRRR
ncbi:Ig-like domain-containing protein [Vitiosangium sp. GDMCC 1.1324]|uniref:adventurous gliding motility protein AgmC n=1 Tax=Vitiosangium sp. (strain GDMCC 1.1324) TaxID=2138576 RepID=UPI000D3C424A|nr:Ig-like domain-containing protein [Vitiosangium sp. GDMCC 1.1324]PTL79951.1 hypothetical protein DAT35_31510 [Vitiosangium sp. GDMCC 1.1324]